MFSGVIHQEFIETNHCPCCGIDLRRISVRGAQDESVIDEKNFLVCYICGVILKIRITDGKGIEIYEATKAQLEELRAINTDIYDYLMEVVRRTKNPIVPRETGDDFSNNPVDIL